jgi:hypothetical protein
MCFCMSHMQKKREAEGIGGTSLWKQKKQKKQYDILRGVHSILFLAHFAYNQPNTSALFKLLV